MLCDEVYRGTDQHGNGYTASIADLYERGISTGSMSKTYSLAGLRLGWIAGPTELIHAVSIHRDYNTISVGMIDDYFACLALEHRDAILERNHRIVRTNLALLDAWIAKEPAISWIKPKSGTTALLKYAFDMPSRDFCIELIEATGVMFTPGSALDMEGYVRIGYAIIAMFSNKDSRGCPGSLQGKRANRHGGTCCRLLLRTLEHVALDPLGKRPLVHFCRAVVDSKRADLAEHLLDHSIVRHARAAHHLHAPVGYAKERVRHCHLRHRTFGCAQRSTVENGCAPVDHEFCLLQVDQVFRKHEADALMVDQQLCRTRGGHRHNRSRFRGPAWPRHMPSHAMRKPCRRQADLRIPEAFIDFSQHLVIRNPQSFEAHDRVTTRQSNYRSYRGRVRYEWLGAAGPPGTSWPPLFRPYCCVP